MKVRSHYIPATQGVTERKREQRKKELVPLDKKGKEKFPVVKVIPNQALSVRDIMDKFVRGIPVDTAGQKPVWPTDDMTHDSPDLNQLRYLDRMEGKDMARTARFKIPKKAEPPISPSAKDDPKGDLPPKS